LTEKNVLLRSKTIIKNFLDAEKTCSSKVTRTIEKKLFRLLFSILVIIFNSKWKWTFASWRN